MPEPDCFLRVSYTLQTRNFITSGKYHVHVLGARHCSDEWRVVLKWFYSPRAVGTTLSEVHALHRVPFYSIFSVTLPEYVSEYPYVRKFATVSYIRANALAAVRPETSAAHQHPSCSCCTHSHSCSSSMTCQCSWLDSTPCKPTAEIDGESVDEHDLNVPTFWSGCTVSHHKPKKENIQCETYQAYLPLELEHC